MHSQTGVCKEGILCVNTVCKQLFVNCLFTSPAGWVTWGDWNGDRNPEILLSGGIGGQNGFEVWTGSGKRLYALAGTGATPMGVESAGPLRPDLDGNGKTDLVLWTRRGYMLLLEAP